MARSTATSRARDDLTRQLKGAVEELAEGYRAQNRAGNQDFEKENRLKTGHIVKPNPAPATIRETQITEQTPPMFYALACLKDREAFKDWLQEEELLDGLTSQQEEAIIRKFKPPGEKR